MHIALYRITQEALNNVVKHARASHASISMSCSHCSNDNYGEETPREITLQIIDDGQGFDQNFSRPDELGLMIMRERAADIGALIQIDSTPGSGTRITVNWQEIRRAAEGKILKDIDRESLED